MLYSSIIPFYSRHYTTDFATHPSFRKLTKLDERKDYAFKDPYKRVIRLDSSKNSLQIPSFYIYTDMEYTGVNTINGFLLYEDGTRIALNSISSLVTFVNNIQRLNYDGTILLVSPPAACVRSAGWPLGPVVLVLNVFNDVTTTTFYSDRLYITDDIYNYVELSWYNDTNLNIGKRIIPYSYGYRPSVFVDAHIGKPSYNFEEEVVERLGYEFVQSAISKKTYNFAFSAPEYLCDSLRIMCICNNKRVIRYDHTNYNETLEPMTVGMDVSWDDQGHLALVSMSLDVDLVATNPSGYAPLPHGDFNNDYNNDFDNH
jgi:hypothetical protein